MNIKKILFFLALMVAQSAFAKNPAEFSPLSHATPAPDEGGCTLQPPSVLNVNNVGIGWVQLSWTAVPGVSQYRIQVVNENNGAILSTTFVPSASLTAQVSTNGATGPCHAEIWSVCGNGSWDGQQFTSSATFDIIILELVVNGLSYPSNPTLDCTVGTGTINGCSINWSADETPFRVKYINNGTVYERHFSTSVVHKPGKYVVYFNSTGDFQQQLAYAVTGLPGAQKFVISYLGGGGESIIAEMGVLYTPSGFSKLYKFADTNSNCTIEKVKQGPGVIGSGDTRSEIAAAPESLLLMAKPNPFSDQLNVQLNLPNEQSTTICSLYDLMGAEKQHFSTAAGQQACTFQTSDLPTGIYFLRIESGGRLETVKVVKGN